MATLGTLHRLDPREVWKGEATHFTPWLAENLDQLADVLGLELELTQREASVGDFAVDLLAHDLGRDRVVIIENQIEPTDHTHLGQLITYAAGLDARVVIWISREFREEHRQALDWLNHVHAGQTEFFGVVVELLQVDDSRPAVNFRLVAFPNEWTRTTASPTGQLSPRREAYRTFFQRLLDELRDTHRFTNARVAQPQSWYSFASGLTGFTYGACFAQQGRFRTELYIDTRDAERNKLVFDALFVDRVAIEASFGEALTWERLDERRACRVSCYRDGSIDGSGDDREALVAWAVDRLLRFKRVFGPKLHELAAVSASPEP